MADPAQTPPALQKSPVTTPAEQLGIMLPPQNVPCSAVLRHIPVPSHCPGAPQSPG
jgi:hypothetical protein